MVSAYVRDMTGTLQLAWYNMPYMRANIKSGQIYVFRGKVVRKRGRLMMEQPEVFTEEAYANIVDSMQPLDVYKRQGDVFGKKLGHPAYSFNKAVHRPRGQALGPAGDGVPALFLPHIQNGQPGLLHGCLLYTSR